MELEFGVIEEERISFVRIIGTIGDADVAALYAMLVEVGHTEDTRPQLVDARRVTDVTLTREGMEHLADRLRQHGPVISSRRVAFLADRDLVYGLLRMWEAERSDFGGEALVFRSENEAIAWLLAPA